MRRIALLMGAAVLVGVAVVIAVGCGSDSSSAPTGRNYRDAKGNTCEESVAHFGDEWPNSGLDANEVWCPSSYSAGAESATTTEASTATSETAATSPPARTSSSTENDFVLRPSASRRLPIEAIIAAIDGGRVAFVAEPHEMSDSPVGLGTWSGQGAVSLINRGSDNPAAAVVGNRIYWSWGLYGCPHDDCGMASELWTAVAPTWVPRRLIRIASDTQILHGVTVAGSGSLVVFGRGGSLFRLRGTTATRIRHERNTPWPGLEPLSVERGRVLLDNGRGRLEVVDANGKLLAQRAAPKSYHGARLSGNRVIVLTEKQILVYRMPSLALRASWPVGAPGTAGRMYGAGIPYGALFPYRIENDWDYAGVRLLNVDTGRDVALKLESKAKLSTMGISAAGGYYTAIPRSGAKGEIGLVPLAVLKAAAS